MEFISCICGGIIEIPASLVVLSTLGVVGAVDLEKWPRDKLEKFVRSKSRVFLTVISLLWFLVFTVVVAIGMVVYETGHEGPDAVNVVLGVLFLGLLPPLVYYATSLTRKRTALLDALPPPQ